MDLELLTREQAVDKLSTLSKGELVNLVLHMTHSMMSQDNALDDIYILYGNVLLNYELFKESGWIEGQTNLEIAIAQLATLIAEVSGTPSIPECNTIQ